MAALPTKADFRVEHLMRRHEATYDIDIVAIDALPEETWLTNPGRDGQPLNLEMAEDFAVAIASGATFPMPVVRIVEGRPEVVSGRHRMYAAKLAKKDAVKCYVVECDDLVAQRLAQQANMVEGQRLTRSDRIAFALAAHAAGQSLDDAAQQYEVTRTQLAQELARQRVRLAVAEKLGSQAARKLPAAAVDALAKWESRPVVMEALADRLASDQLAAGDVQALSLRLKQQASDDERLALITQAAPARRSSSPRPIVRQMLTHMRQAFAELAEVEGDQLSSVQREELMHLVAEAPVWWRRLAQKSLKREAATV